MQIIDRKSLTEFQTSFLIKIKHTLLKRIENEKEIDRPHTKMLVDVLCELDTRRIRYSS